MQLTAAQLRQLFPGLSKAKCAAYAPHFSTAATDAKINTRARLCAFVAQLGHESEDLSHLKEIWGPTPAQSRYDIRVDLGNTPARDGDGEKYKGRGGIGRTGKKQYRRMQDATGLPVVDHPELLERPEYAFVSDALYWTDNNLNKLADKLTLTGDAADLKQFDKLTRAINGGYNGRVDRQRRYLVAIANLPASLFETTAAPASVAQTSAFDTLAAKNDTNRPVDETKSPIREPISPSDETVHTVLLERLKTSDEAKNLGKSAATKLGLKLAAPMFLLYEALKSGNLTAWVFVIILLAFAGFLIYRQRAPLMHLAKSLLKTT